MVNVNRIYRVPDDRGGTPYMTNIIKHLIGEWEIVTPEQVLGERGEIE